MNLNSIYGQILRDARLTAQSQQIAMAVKTVRLAQVETLVKAMRILPSTEFLQNVGRLHVSTETLIANVMAPALNGMQTAIHAQTSLFSTQMLEVLRLTQSSWLQMTYISDEFVRLQNILHINLKQFLHDQTASYQMWLEKQDYTAFTEAFVLCVSKMSYCALHIVRNTEDAKDIVQDAYEKAWRKLQSYSIDQIRVLKVEPWLICIVKRTAYNFLRDQQRNELYEMNWMEQQPGSRFDQPEANLIRQELLQTMYKSFQALPAIQHTIIFMRYLGTEASLQEIADYLERPLGTIKAYLSRGLHKLRQQLADQNLSALDFEGLIETLSRWPYTATSRELIGNN